MDTFVRLKGYRLVLGDDEVYEITMAVARSDMGKNGVVSSIEANVVPG